MPGHKIILQEGEKIRDGLTCSHCELILSDAIQTSETGLRFCKDCFEKASRSSVDCNDTAWPDFAVKKEVANLKILCKNCKAGCDWKGLFKDLSKHLPSCQFITVECANTGCTAQVLISELEDHMRDQCVYRLVQCSDCGVQLCFGDLPAHENCPNAPKKCENCDKIVPASQLPSHLATECNHMKCCGEVYQVGSKELADHLQDANKLSVHLMPMITQFSKMSQQSVQVSKLTVSLGTVSQEFNEMKGDYQLASGKIIDLEKKVESLERANAVLEQSNSQFRSTLGTVEEKFTRTIATQPISQDSLEYNYDEIFLFEKNYNRMEEPEIPPGSTIDQNRAQVQVMSSEVEAVKHQDTNPACKQFGENKVVPHKPDSEFSKELEGKILEVERTLNVLRVHHSDLESQLQASLASTHNGVFLWRIPEVHRRVRDAKIGRITSIYSPPFYTGRNGYKMCIRAYLNGDGNGENTHLSIFFVLMRGEYDPLLQWPFEAKVSLILVDQDHKKHMVQTFKPDPQSSSFQKPKTDMNFASGWPIFAELSILDNPSYVKEDVMYIKAIVDTTNIRSCTPDNAI